MRNPFEIEELLKSRRVSKETVAALKKPEYKTLDEQRKEQQNWGWLDDTVPQDYQYPEEDSSAPDEIV